MKTIAQSVGAEEIDWRAELAAAKDYPNGGSESLRLKYLAQSYNTCAVSTQDARIPREDFGPSVSLSSVPADGRLRDLGLRFSSLVNGFEYDAALSTLVEIEARSKEIVDNLPAAE